MFHDVYNIEMNRPGQNRDYEEEEDPEQDENIDVLNQINIQITIFMIIIEYFNIIFNNIFQKICSLSRPICVELQFVGYQTSTIQDTKKI